MGRHRPHLPTVRKPSAAVPQPRGDAEPPTVPSVAKEKYHTLGNHRLAARTEGGLGHVEDPVSGPTVTPHPGPVLAHPSYPEKKTPWLSRFPFRFID